MGPYEELVRSTVDAVRWPDEPVSLERLARMVALRVSVTWSDVQVALGRVLRADPRFVEVAPGMWVRRRDGPEAGVPSRPRRPPSTDSAAATAAPPEQRAELDAVAGAGPPHEIRTPQHRFRGDPGGGRATTAS